MTPLMFYKSPELLDRERHQKLRFQAIRDFSFSAGFNAVPAAGIEFFEASRDMSILFHKDAEGKFFPLIFMSLLQDKHDKLEADGRWKGTYTPSYIQRYPFLISSDGQVYFDSSSGAFTEEEGKGERLFTEDGKNSELLEKILQSLAQYDMQMKRTADFCDALDAKGFLQPYDVQVGGNTDNPVNISGLYSIDESKFPELQGEELATWYRNSWLAWSYAHLHSLGALRLLTRPPAQVQQVSVKNPKI